MFTIGEPLERERLLAAAPAAIAAAAREMLEPSVGEFGGMPALDRLAAEAGEWPAVAEDWRWCARFAYQVIERRGTGGGCFRTMYGRFLAEAGRPEAALATAAGERWSELAECFQRASESEAPNGLWKDVGTGASAVAAAERELWEALAA